MISPFDNFVRASLSSAFRPSSPSGSPAGMRGGVRGGVRETARDAATFERRSRLAGVTRWLSSCVVCESCLPPIDYLCTRCWREFGDIMNRGEQLKQDYVLPTYSLITWTPQNESFVRPFIYGFKGGWRARAAEKCAEIFLGELMLANGLTTSDRAIVSAPGVSFDHSKVWAAALARTLRVNSPVSPFESANARVKGGGEARQKELRQGERGSRRYVVREVFAGWAEPARRYVFADDVVTSGSTAMAAYMALGDPDVFEVWSLVSRPRLAAKVSFC